MRKMMHLLLVGVLISMLLTGCSMKREEFQGGGVSFVYNSGKWELTQQVEKTETPILVLCKKDHTAMIAVQAFTSEKELQSDTFFAAIKEMDQETGTLKDEIYDTLPQEEITKDTMSYQCELEDGTNYSIRAQMQKKGETQRYLVAEGIAYEETPRLEKEITGILQTIAFSEAESIEKLSDTPSEYRQLGATLDEYILLAK